MSGPGWLSQPIRKNGDHDHGHPNLRNDLNGADAHINDMDEEIGRVRAELRQFREIVGANLASLNEITALLAREVAPGTPGLDVPAWDTLRRLSFCLGFEFLGESRPGDWDTPAELARLLGETGADEPDEREIPGFNPDILALEATIRRLKAPEPMSAATALTRVDWVLERYEDCDSTVLRVLSAADLDAVKVIADIARRSG